MFSWFPGPFSIIREYKFVVRATFPETEYKRVNENGEREGLIHGYLSLDRSRLITTNGKMKSSRDRRYIK